MYAPIAIANSLKHLNDRPGGADGVLETIINFEAVIRYAKFANVGRPDGTLRKFSSEDYLKQFLLKICPRSSNLQTEHLSKSVFSILKKNCQNKVNSYLMKQFKKKRNKLMSLFHLMCIVSR